MAFVDVKYLTMQIMTLLVTYLPITVHIHSNSDIPPLPFHRILWWYVESSGKAKYLIVWEFLFTDFHGRQARVVLFREEGVGAIYLGLTYIKCELLRFFRGTVQSEVFVLSGYCAAQPNDFFFDVSRKCSDLNFNSRKSDVNPLDTDQCFCARCR